MCSFSPDQCCFFSSKCAGNRITWEVLKDFFITFNYVFAGEGHMYVIVGRYGAGCWEWNSGLLQEQYVLLTTEKLLEMQSWVSALRSQNPHFNKEIVTLWLQQSGSQARGHRLPGRGAAAWSGSKSPFLSRSQANGWLRRLPDCWIGTPVRLRSSCGQKSPSGVARVKLNRSPISPRKLGSAECAAPEAFLMTGNNRIKSEHSWSCHVPAPN